MVKYSGGKPIMLPTKYEDNFSIDIHKFESLITERTKLFMINSPNNPSGKYYDAEMLKKLSEVLNEHNNVFISSDDIYEHIHWGSEKFHNILNVNPELKSRTIILNGVSKAYSMTGWRIGYAAGPVEIIKAISKIQSQSTSNPSSCLLYTSPSPRDLSTSRMPSSA